MGLEDNLRRVEEHVADARRLVQRQKGLIIRLAATILGALWIGRSQKFRAFLFIQMTCAGLPLRAFAVLLLHEKRVDEIVPKLSAADLEQVIKLVGRSPSAYPPKTLDALKQRRALASEAATAAERQRPQRCSRGKAARSRRRR
jgi:hypothetical protein